MDRLVLTDTDELRELMSSVVVEAIEGKIINAVKRGFEKPYLTKKELMALTGWSSRQVEYKKQKRELPFIRRGRLILFPTDAVHDFLRAGLVPAKSNGQ